MLKNVKNTTIILLILAVSLFAQTRPFPMVDKFVTGGTVIKPSNKTQKQLNDDVIAKYTSYKSRFLKSAAGDKYYILSTGNGPGGTTALTISEAHGYGMIIFALMAGYDPDAKKIFDGLNKLRKAQKATGSGGNDLMSWVAVDVDSDNPASSQRSSSATDGDLDNAYALLLAYAQWGDVAYLNDAKTLISAIKQYEMAPTSRRVKLGNWQGTSSQSNTRSSDWMTGHFRAFNKATNDNFWLEAVDTIYKVLLPQSSNSTTGLIPCFVTGSPAVPDPTGGGTGESNAEHYWYNACRDPWRLATDYLHHGTLAAKDQINKISSWLKTSTSSNVNNIRAGYKLDGTQLVTYSGLEFVAPFTSGLIADPANQTYLNSAYDRTVNMTANPNVYAAAIQLLNMLLISGNWWAPYSELIGEPVTKYTVSFESNGGSAVSPITDVASGAKISKPSPNPTKNGYTFGEWYKEAALTNLWNFTNDIVSKNTTLYAKWTATNCNITYTLNGGSGATNRTYTIETADITLPIPTRSGYLFDGWYENSDFTGAKITAIPKGSTGNKSFYAKWLETKITITTNSLVDGTYNEAYSATVSATIENSTGGTISYSVRTGGGRGNLPNGLTLNSSTGIINGTPTAAGSFTFTIRATNVVTADKDFTIVIEKALLTRPEPATNLTYNGNVQVGISAGANYTVTKDGSATNAGNYTAILTSGNNYQWDNGKDTVHIAWSIGACLHDWNDADWTITKKPDCDENGSQERVCRIKDCGEKQFDNNSDKLPKLNCCDICGEPDCEIEHVFCDICEIYDCGKTHILCSVCGKYDCEYEHIYCDICEIYDCGINHETPIIQGDKKLDRRYGIKFVRNPVLDGAEVFVILPNNEKISEIKIVIYDITGNVVHSVNSRNSEFVWNLQNNGGKNVANGTYLVIAEVKSASGNVYRYSSKLGVKR